MNPPINFNSSFRFPFNYSLTSLLLLFFNAFHYPSILYIAIFLFTIFPFSFLLVSLGALATAEQYVTTERSTGGEKALSAGWTTSIEHTKT